MPAVLNRPLESRAVSDFLRSAAQQPSGLLIEGEPGIGKTTLWLSAVEQARDNGYRVFSARVGQAESVLAYAAVADLLRDIDPTVLAELPDVQRVAVDRVLLRASSEDHTTDQHVVAAAFAAVFDRLAADSPVLIAIDDLQWLDRSSKDVLAFAARRFKGPVIADHRTVGCRRRERGDVAAPFQTRWHRPGARRPAEPRRPACADLHASRTIVPAADDGANRQDLRRKPVLRTRTGPRDRCRVLGTRSPGFRARCRN